MRAAGFVTQTMEHQSRNKALFRAKLKEQAQKTRIDSPLLRYNELDQLVCRVCDVVLKSESLWPAHQASKKHHEAINHLKANASRQSLSSNVKSAPLKDLPKSNSDGSTLSHDARQEISPAFQGPKESSALPANFFDRSELKRPNAGSGTSKSIDSGSSVKAGPLAHKAEVGKTIGEVKSPGAIQAKQRTETSISGSESTEKKGALPEGFFDNKEADLRARGIQLVKPDVKDEYKEFEKLIQEDLKEVDNRFEEEEIDAAEMIEEEETVEQMTYKERIEMLKRKRMELVNSRLSKPDGDSNAPSKKNKFDEDESSSEDDGDESFAVDWRAQHL